MLINLENVSKIFADRIVFTGANLTVEEGDRIGLVGANGVGKTTLLSVICGDLIPDEGAVAIQNGVSIGFLRQNSGVDGSNTIYEEMRSVFADLLNAQEQLRRLNAQMGQYTDHDAPEYLALSEEYNRLQAYFETNEGYQIDVKIRTVLNGMGFGGRDDTTICATLSGGEKTRLALAKLLLQNPAVLMLDEPTNHLDFPTLQWLEEYLQAYRGALIVVSHDRYFLDKLCNRIWDLLALRLTAYKGNYTKFVKTREMVFERQQKDYEMQKANVTKLTDYIARNKARASTAAMARSKEKALARMEPVKAPPRPPTPVRMAFRFEQDPVKDVLHVEALQLSVGAGESFKRLCDGADFDLLRGEKVALVGRNGVGKSTFLKALINLIPPEGGRVKWGRNVKLSYFEQEQTGLHAEKTMLAELWDRWPATYEQDVRNVLGSLGFSGETIYKQVGMLSGGERARLKFGIMMYECGNVLLLDEPTNHLDLPTKEVLDKALMDFPGTVLMVSHDRYLLSKVPTRIVEMCPDGFVSYEGGYENYLEKTQTPKAPAAPKAEPVKVENEYYRGKKERARLVAARQRLQVCEQAISDLEYDIAEKQATLIDPEVSRDYQKVSDLCAELDRMRTQLAAHMEEWAELSSELENEPR